MKNIFATLFNRKFFPFFISQWLNIFNDNFFRTACVFFIILNIGNLPKESCYIAAYLLIVIFVFPSLVFSSFAGEIADKFPKDKIIKILNFISVFFIFAGISGFILHNIWIILISLFFMGTVSAFLSPLKYSAVAELLEYDRLVAANSLIQAGIYIAMFAAIFCASAVYFSGINFISLILSVSGILAFTASVFIPSLKPAVQKLDISFNIVKSFFINLKYLKHTKDIYLCILGISWFWFIGVVLISQIPSFTTIVIHGQVSLYIFIISIFATGIVAGTLTSYFLLKKEISIKYVPISAVLMTVFIIDLSVIISKTDYFTIQSIIDTGDLVFSFAGKRMIFDLAAFSFFAGLYIVPLITMLQVVASRKIRARVIAVNNITNILFMALGIIFLYLFAKADFNIHTIFTFIAVFNIIATLYICGLLPAHLLRLITKHVMSVFYKIEVTGMEHFNSRKGGTIIIANHTSFIDGIILSVVFGEKVSFAINSDVAEKFWVKPFLKMIKFFPVDNTNVMIVKSIADELKKGGTVAVFPEGRITTTGGLMKIYPAPAMVADRTNADILPVCIDGVQYSGFSYVGSKLKAKRQRKIKITILPARKLGVDPNLSDSQRRTAAVTKLYDIMTEMKFASLNTAEPLFSSLLKTLKLVGKDKDIIEDVNREPLKLKTFVSDIFLFAGSIRRYVTQNEYVGFMFANTIMSAEMFFALSSLNTVICMLNYTETEDNIVASIKNTGIKTVFTSKKFIETFNMHNIIKIFEANKIKTVYFEDLHRQISYTDKISAKIKTYFADYYCRKTVRERSASDPAVVLYTAGFSGRIKASVLTHKNIQASKAQVLSVFDFGAGDIFFNAMPAFNSFGLTAGMIMPLLNGIKIFMYHSPVHYRQVSELVYDTDATVILGTDAFLNGYAATAHPYDFYGVRIVISAGEKLRAETVKLWEQVSGKRIFEAYGTTETSSVVSVNTPMYFKSGTAGRFLPSVEYRLQDIKDLGKGKLLFVKGPNISNVYIEHWQNIENPAMEDGWFNTGDIVSVDGDGFVRFEGRAYRITEIDGQKISLANIESAVSKVWKQYKNAVVSVKGKIFLFTTNKNPDTDEILEYYGRQNADYPEIAVKTVDDIPITGSGMTNYIKLEHAAETLV